MALHVTQCPSCDSTFNTSAAMLELAEGKVRCGACLSIFQAIDNFVDPLPATEQQEEDSVFVGNNPQDYFDPTKFLTRSALQQEDEETEDTEKAEEEDETQSVIPDEPDISADPIVEESLELSEEYTKEFFAAIEQTMEESLKEAESEKDVLLEQLQANESSFFEDIQTPLISEAESIKPELFPDSSDELVDPFENVHKADEVSNETEDSAENDINLVEAEDSEIESRESFRELPEEFSAHSITETETPTPPQDLFPDSIREQADEDLPSTDEFVAQSITEIEAPEQESTEEVTEVADDSATENDLVSSVEPQESSKPEDLQLSVSFSVQHQSIQSRKAENEERFADVNESTAPPADEEIAAAESHVEPKSSEHKLENERVSEEVDRHLILENELNQEIAEHDFKESIADGLESANTEFETALFSDASEPFPADESSTDEFGFSADIDESNVAVGDDAEQFVDETEDNHEEEDKKDKEAEQEDSTEAIRARALEAELADESALESIPEENLAALDVSSTPVELIAGVQHKFGRQILLGLVVLVLGGSLGAQYLWQNMVALSQNDRVRPFYELACSFTACTLPDYSDISAIRSDTLTVRSHPELENGIAVNIEFRNTAAFPQAFPVMVLSFNSASNEIVALREFSPDEYLDPGLQDIAMMPVLAPVQVSLELMDPGPGAVNYTLAFRLP